MSSSQPKSYSPFAGSSQDHEKTPEGHEGDPGLAHQVHVLVPDLARPLLGVVVAAEGDAGRVGHWRMAVSVDAAAAAMSTKTNMSTAARSDSRGPVAAC